jgi:hypothetical protein
MGPFEIRPPAGPERGVRVGCTEHDEWTEFPVGVRRGAVACDSCGLELSVDLRNLHDWRDWGERC